MVFVVKSLRPGSSRSGENARRNSFEHLSPLSSRIARTSVSVVPGYVVDSRTTSCPYRSRFAISRAVEWMYELSGSRCGPSGVGTQMRIASHARSSLKSVVAR